jgi:uncharacterized protein (TIGR02145 family)
MKKQQNLLLLVLLLGLSIILNSCQKNPASPPLPSTPTTVRIGEANYSVHLIGSQLWTILNYAGPGGRAFKTGTEKPEYGRYYTFAEAKAIPMPTGWRLPTMQDYLIMAQQQGIIFTNGRATNQEAIKKLTSVTNWRSIAGTNASEFNAYPAGYWFENNEPQEGDIVEFWTAEGNTISIQENAAGQTHIIRFYNNSTSTAYRFNLRFVRDY